MVHALLVNAYGVRPESQALDTQAASTLSPENTSDAWSPSSTTPYRGRNDPNGTSTAWLALVGIIAPSLVALSSIAIAIIPLVREI